MSGKKRKSKSFALLAMALFLAGGGVAVYIYLQFPYLFSNKINGIDVSHHNGTINWKKVKKSGIHFAFVKASEGATLGDEDFDYNWKECRNQKIMCGAYHFFIPSVDAEKQARNFLDRISLSPGDLPPVLDLEITSGKSSKVISDGALKWMQRVEAETGMKPILYTLPRFANDFLKQKLKDYPLWIVDLGKGDPQLPNGNESWTFWQYSHTGRIPGISTKVDMNYFNGTLEELRMMGK